MIRDGNHFIQLHKDGRWILIDGPWYDWLENQPAFKQYVNLSIPEIIDDLEYRTTYNCRIGGVQSAIETTPMMSLLRTHIWTRFRWDGVHYGYYFDAGIVPTALNSDRLPPGMDNERLTF